MTPAPLTLVLGTYLAPIEEVDVHRGAHSAFLDELVADGRVLVAGRRTPPEGSVLVLRATAPETVAELLAADPYVVAGVVRYDVAGVFTPGKHPPELGGLLGA